jgi:hypothetical protein
MKRHLLLAISVLALTAMSQPLFAAEAETPAASERAPAAERAPARERAERPTRERAPVQRQAAQSSPTSSFTGNQASAFGGGNTGGGGFADPTWCGSSFSPSCPLTTQDISRSTGFIGGLEYGYLFPIAPYWVAGWAVDIAGSTLKSSNTQTTSHHTGGVSCCLVTETLSASQSQSVLSTWRLTAGFVPMRNWLVFATAGAAVGTVSGNFTYTASSDFPATAAGGGSYNQVRFGYTAGGGVSWAYPVFGILGARVTVEYLYTNLGKVTEDYVLVPSCTGCTPGLAETSMRTDTHTYRLKVGLPL